MTFGEQETGGQLIVVARRAHRGGQRLAVELDSQRLFDRDFFVLLAAGAVGGDAQGDGGAHRVVHEARSIRTAVL